MPDLFITKVHIKKVRHLKDIDITLSKNEKKHLILTGKNGSGKTSLLSALSKRCMSTKNLLKNNSLGIWIEGKCEDVRPEFSITPAGNWIMTDDIFLYIPAGRLLNLELPRSIEIVDLSEAKSYENMANKKFIKYLVHLNYQKMSAMTSNNHTEACKIEKWFENFTNALRDIYNCPELVLEHNSKDLSFKIKLPNREPFGLNEMSDGYSAFLNIVIELMMRMENDADITYDLPGIVLVDEIETHLHIELQKRILPFLVKMFPRIQFIVTTHSPFVITSVSNTVVYDLEKQITVEDMSAYSYEAVIEHFYDVNMYSVEADKQFGIYKALIDKNDRSPGETEQLVEAITYLKQIPVGAAEELVYSFREMEAKRRQTVNGKTQ